MPCHLPSNKYPAVASVIDAIVTGCEDAARRILSRLLNSLQGGDGEPEDIQALIFARALSKRLAWERHEEINLYLQQLGLPQIALFNLVAKHLPTVALAGQVGNEILAEQFAGNDEITLLDIGIGTGQQEIALIRLLAERSALPRVLHVVALEPDPSSLACAGGALHEIAAQVGLDLRFYGVNKLVEELGQEDWDFFATLPGKRVVNASFAVHHVRNTESLDARDDLFRRLRALGAEAVVLCEPNADHLNSSLRRRFQHCWQHFGATFQLIDSLGLSREERNAMKMFFAREIEDILASAEERRYERHEPAARWLSRLAEAGFQPANDLGRIGAEGRGGVEVVAREGYVGLDFQQETLVAIVCAVA